MAAEARFPPIDSDLLVARAADLTPLESPAPSLEPKEPPTSRRCSSSTETGGATPQRSVHGGPAPSTATAAGVDAQPRPAGPVIAIGGYPDDLSNHCRSTVSHIASDIGTTVPADSVHPASPLGSPLPPTREPLPASLIPQPPLGRDASSQTVSPLNAASNLTPNLAPCSSGMMHCDSPPSPLLQCDPKPVKLDVMPNELLTHILGFLDVSDVLVTSRISRRLARNLVAIRLARRLPLRPSAESLAQRGVLPHECVVAPKGTLADQNHPPGTDAGATRLHSSPPSVSAAPGKGPGGLVVVAPSLVATRRAVEKERIKDGLRRWVAGTWRGCVRERAEGVKLMEEKAGVGRVWRLRQFWERVSREGRGG